jgi:hypothetical protein
LSVQWNIQVIKHCEFLDRFQVCLVKQEGNSFSKEKHQIMKTLRIILYATILIALLYISLNNGDSLTQVFPYSSTGMPLTKQMPKDILQEEIFSAIVEFVIA